MEGLLSTGPTPSSLMIAQNFSQSVVQVSFLVCLSVCLYVYYILLENPSKGKFSYIIVKP